MKKVRIVIITMLFLAFQVNVNAQNEKKIKFNKGTLKICSSKKFQITGYDGDEVIIKSLHKKNSNYSTIATTYDTAKKIVIPPGTSTINSSGKDHQGIVHYFVDTKRSKGLKKLGKKNENKELGIYFVIEQKEGELIFRDNHQNGTFVMVSSNEQYEIKIPNSIKLNWVTGSCANEEIYSGTLVQGRSNQTVYFYNSNPSSLNDFSGEVEISSTLSNLKLKDVVGPVSINTVGGNITVEFENKKPTKLYSIYTNNGFIDITLPSSSAVNIDANGKAIYSDIDFKIDDEKEDNDFHYMKLRLNGGKSKMKLNAGLGNIYLRKKSNQDIKVDRK